jgi:8-oxo-dGTP pyrophosphatase MutT (NUDIX family)
MPDNQEAEHHAESWSALRARVAEADHALSLALYTDLRRAFSDWASDPTGLQQLTSEYERPEFLMPVDRTGMPIPLSEDVLEDFEQTAAQCPDFNRWFQVATLPEGDHRTLLVGRWLCHLLGFRHRVVHLFIDHPTLDGYTLVQVRGLRKLQSPGRFGVPAAGHIVGSTPVREALFQELHEELNLARGDVDNLKQIGAYDHQDALVRNIRNIEFRLVFRGQLKGDRLFTVQFADGEVAALAVFVLSELQALIERFPERVSSDLSGSLPVYLGLLQEHPPCS